MLLACPVQQCESAVRVPLCLCPEPPLRCRHSTPPGRCAQRAGLPVLRSGLPLASAFPGQRGSVGDALSVLHSPLRWSVQKAPSLQLCFYSCPDKRFICTIFQIPHIRVNIHFLCFLTYLTVSDSFRSMHISEMTLLCSFLWLSNVPLFICTTSFVLTLYF